MKHQYWLVKQEPESYSWDDFVRDKTTAWEGVRNYQARNLIRDQIQKGDQAFLYHSSCEQPGITGIVRVVRAAYPDPTAFDRRDSHYDAASKPSAPRWFTFDVRLTRRFKRVIGLDELRAHSSGELAGMQILRAGNRLSVTPVEHAHWRFILTLE